MQHCNANNHRSNCECGFGGTIAKASPLSKKMYEEVLDLFTVPRIPRHYTKQNERCPFCNDPVFFRHLINGGRVYFDEPGVPWPKHPCTDKASMSYRGPFGPGTEGWPQLTQISAKSVSDTVFRLSGKLQNQDYVVFVGRSVFTDAPDSATYLSESFIQAQRNLRGQVDLALMTPDLKHILLTGYLEVDDADHDQASQTGSILAQTKRQ